MDAVHRHMAGHHGIVTRSKALRLGMSKSAVARRVRAGAWEVLVPGVYRAAGAPDTWESRVRGLALSYDGLASHRSAARLWGLPLPIDGRVEITVDAKRAPRPSGVVVHRSKQMDLAARTVRDGVPVTGLARTVLDLAAVLDHHQLNNVVDHVLRRRSLNWHDLLGVLVRHSRRGRDGCGKLRALLDERYGEKRPPDSAFNRMVGQLLVDSSVGKPVYEHEIRDCERFVARVDIAFPGQRVAIELDSRAFHDNPLSFVDDRRRANRITNLGWHLLMFTWDDYRDMPHILVQTVRDALRPAATR